jgi:hypothetical protein
LASKPKASTAKRRPINADEGKLSDDPESSSSDNEDYVPNEDPPALGKEVEDRVESSIKATANTLS